MTGADLERATLDDLAHAAYAVTDCRTATAIRCELRLRAQRIASTLHRITGGPLTTYDLARIGSLGADLADIARAIHVAGTRANRPAA